MQKYHDTVLKKVKRLFWALFSQSLWLIPLCILIWYVKGHVGDWFSHYFNLDEARKMADYFAKQAEKTSSPVIWNPGAIVTYLKALFLSLTASTKYNSLSTISDLLSRLVSIILSVIQFIGIVYAVIRVKRAYFASKHTDTIANTLCREIMPEIDSLRTEIQRLNTLIEDMKKQTDASPQ